MFEQPQNFLRELVRRRVLRTSGVYLVAVWGVSQGAAELFPLFGASDDHVRYFIFVSLGFLPIVAGLAWKYDIGVQGIKRDPHDVPEVPQEYLSSPESADTVVGRQPTQGCVRVTFRDADGDKVVLLTGDFSLGRAGECAVQFKDPVVSRKHADVFFKDGQWIIRDLGSTNGTWLDGVKIEETVLPAESKVRVNEEGPPLRFAVLPPGPVSEQAIGELGATAGKAIVRTR